MYYCFLCNENHDDSPTEEHFIPRSIKGPEDQWLPVCKTSNTRSNYVFDNEVRDILYMARYRNTKILKRTGDALLCDGTLKKYKFSYNDEPQRLKSTEAFHYFFDNDTNNKIPSSSVCAIKFSIGLDQKEQEIFCRGLAKMSIGALAYLLKKEGVQNKKIKRLFSQISIDSLRHFALNLPWPGGLVSHMFSLGRTDIINNLQHTCRNPLMSNHVIEINFHDKKNIRIEGMLYSKYGWQLMLPSNISFDFGVLRLENSISDLPAPDNLLDSTLSPDSICIINPIYKGEKPPIPQSWRNNS
jgi:hypothetical protein